MRNFGSTNNIMKAIMNSLNDELLVVDRDYRIIEANDAILAGCNKTRQQVIGQHCYEISHGVTKPCRRPYHECPIAGVKETGEPVRVTHIHIHITRDRRQKRYIDVIASPITDNKGNIIAFSELMRDVTEAKKAELKIAKLHQEVENKEKVQRELLHQLFSIQEEERKRIAREMHDETIQELASLAVYLEVVASTLPANVDKAKTELKKAQDLSISIIEGIEKFIYELRPSLLDDLGLVSAIRWLADNTLEKAGIAVHFNLTGRDRRISSQMETNIFRIIQEAINNIAKHASAKNTIISVDFKRNNIRVCVKDDGKGFDVQEAMDSKDRPRGLGLLGMMERVEIINGKLTIDSYPGGNGTEIAITIPLFQTT